MKRTSKRSDLAYFGEIAPPLKILASFVNFGRRMGFHPYKWSPKDKCFISVDSKRYYWIHALWCGVMWTYAAFLMYSCYQVAHDPKSSTFSKVRIVYMSIAYGFLNFGFFINFQVYGQHHIVINQIVSFVKDFKGHYNVSLGLNSLKWILRIANFTYFFGCTNAIAVFLTPKSQRLLTSLFEDPTKAPIAAKICLFVVHLLLNTCQFYFAIFNAMVLLSYIHMMTPIIKRLRWNKTIRGLPNIERLFLKLRGEEFPLTPLEIHQNFATMTVVQAGFTSVFAPWVLLITVWSTTLATLNLFQCVIFEHARSFVMSLVVSFLLATGAKTAGSLYEIAVSVKLSWMAIKRPEWFQKYVRAARPARVPLGTIFYFDKGLWPTLFNIIITTAVNLIVSYRE